MAHAQSRIDIEAPWRAGVSAGISYNMLGLGQQYLEPSGAPNFVPLVITDGTGIGPYASIFGEYVSKSWWGAQLRASYDVRSGSVSDPATPLAKSFDTRMNYISIEPLLRIDPGVVRNAYLVVGPQLGINTKAEFDFTDPNHEINNVTNQQLVDARGATIGANFGIGYDMTFGSRTSDLRYYLSPFLESSWMLYQREGAYDLDLQDRFDDIWSTTSIRAGISLKLGIMPAITELSADESLGLALFAPDRMLRSRRYEEYFPLVTSVFFDTTSSEIPLRYHRRSGAEAGTFTENDLLEPSLVGTLDSNQRRAEQMNIYYEVMNIYGARMRANPAATLTLIGSGSGRPDGAEMANNVRSYMVSAFGIDPSRITTEGRDLPRYPSGSERTPLEDKYLTVEENRRVEFVSGAVDLGTPVLLRTTTTTPIENDLVMNVSEDGSIVSWRMTITGEGKTRTYGPYSNGSERINPSDLMAGLEEGEFVAELQGTTSTGKSVNVRKDFKLVKRDDPGVPARRYSIVFRYGQDDAVRTYDDFLRNVVAPKIESGANVIIIGHTDNIGDPASNLALARKRAIEVRDMLRAETNRLGHPASYQATGEGEEETRTTFSNTLPEGRFYNRNVMIDVVPKER
jgi:outer membrane protein OmpA-like peptidoglycan-associated protein